MITYLSYAVKSSESSFRQDNYSLLIHQIDTGSWSKNMLFLQDVRYTNGDDKDISSPDICPHTARAMTRAYHL